MGTSLFMITHGQHTVAASVVFWACMLLFAAFMIKIHLDRRARRRAILERRRNMTPEQIAEEKAKEDAFRARLDKSIEEMRQRRRDYHRNAKRQQASEPEN
jgi:uncharacterized protein YlxW (UPF0749 family)